MRPEQDARVARHGRTQPLDLGLVVVDLRVEAALEDHPPDGRHDVDEPPAPARGELVQDRARLLQRRRILTRPVPHGAQPGPEPPGGQDLLLDQARRLVPGAAQPVLGPVERERGPAGHVRAEGRPHRWSRPSARAASRSWRARRPAKRPGRGRGPGSAAAAVRWGDMGRARASGRPAGPGCSSGSQATRTGTRAVSSPRSRTSAGTSAPAGPRLTRGSPAPPAAATRSRMSRVSVGVPACTSSTVSPEPGQAGQLAHDGISPSSVAGQSASSSR